MPAYTLFQICLPHKSLAPQFRMTPPLQKLTVTSPVNSESPEPDKTSRHSGSAGSDVVPMVSPSELDTSVFKSPTPDSSESPKQVTTDCEDCTRLVQLLN